jgi:hypothetical protein
MTLEPALKTDSLPDIFSGSPRGPCLGVFALDKCLIL